MGLEADGVTVASHLVMIVVIVLVAVRGIRAVADGAIVEAVRQHDLAATLAIGLAMLGIERGYYVAARLLRRQGVDLWAAHPAPEVLSVMVAGGLYAIMLPVVQARSDTRMAAWRRIGIELGAIVAVWVTLAAVFY